MTTEPRPESRPAPNAVTHLPPVPRTLWVVRVLYPAGGLWHAEKPIRTLEALPAVGDPMTLDDGTPGRVEGVCSPAMSGVHADIYTSRIE